MTWDGTVSVGSVLTAILLLVGFGGFLSRVQSSMSLVTAEIRDLAKAFRDFAEDSARDRQAIRERVARLEGAIEWPLLTEEHKRATERRERSVGSL